MESSTPRSSESGGVEFGLVPRLMLSHPFDRLAESLLQRVDRPPARQPEDFRVVTAKPLHLTRGGPHPPLVLSHANVDPDQSGDNLDKITHRDFAIRAYVRDLAP